MLKNTNSKKNKLSKTKPFDDKKSSKKKSYKLKDFYNKKKKAEGPMAEAETSIDEIGQYKIQHKDISKRPEVSIWKIINNRYLQSGYPKLFTKESPQKPIKN